MYTDLPRANFKEASIKTTGSFADITLQYTDLTRANFKEASLATTGEQADIEFYGSDLTDAKFDGANIGAKDGYVYNSDGSKLSQGQTPS